MGKVSQTSNPKRKEKADDKVFEKAKKFVNDPVKPDALPDENEHDAERLKMKEIKREKMRLKRLKKKEDKLKQFKKRQTDDFTESALSYLRLWRNEKNKWSFKKNMQLWLLSNMYDTGKICDEDFDTFMSYMQESKGAARERTVKQAESMIKTWDERDKDDQDLGSPKVDEQSYDRARNVVQYLV